MSRQEIEWESQPILPGLGGARKRLDGAKSKRIDHRLHQLQTSWQIPAEFPRVGSNNYLQWTPGNTHPQPVIIFSPSTARTHQVLIYASIVLRRERKLQKTGPLSKDTN